MTEFRRQHSSKPLESISRNFLPRFQQFRRQFLNLLVVVCTDFYLKNGPIFTGFSRHESSKPLELISRNFFAFISAVSWANLLLASQALRTFKSVQCWLLFKTHQTLLVSRLQLNNPTWTFAQFFSRFRIAEYFHKSQSFFVLTTFYARSRHYAQMLLQSNARWPGEVVVEATLARCSSSRYALGIWQVPFLFSTFSRKKNQIYLFKSFQTWIFYGEKSVLYLLTSYTHANYSYLRLSWAGEHPFHLPNLVVVVVVVDAGVLSEANDQKPAQISSSCSSNYY